jgi:aerotaxis receptor
MKKNLPITNNEVPFPEGEEIISTTDLKGSITGYNDTFINISGFPAEELDGVNHNVVRHPDMPPAAFADLWTTIKANHHWMGIVKNRCKNGDFYWVDAYVTPMVEDGQIVGYESVRAKPHPEDVERAEKIYSAINKGKKPTIGSFIERLTLSTRMLLGGSLAIVASLITLFLTQSQLGVSAYGLAILVAGLSLFFSMKWAVLPLKQALKKVHKEVNNPLMALVYTGRDDEIGQIQLPALLLSAKLRTILGRINDASIKIAGAAEQSAHGVQDINDALQEQATQSDLISTAVTEMSASASEVARTAAHAAELAAQADALSQDGVRHASGAANGLDTMTSAVNNIADVVSELESNTQNIDTILNVIQSIAEQTNLLALNAAIEAARAGEQGRGFAVVADEVRTLASRTHESTEEIQTLIGKLNSAVSRAVTVLAESRSSATDSSERITNAISSLDDIARQISGINDLNTLIATAVDEQSKVSHELSGNINNVNQSMAQTLEGAKKSGNSAVSLENSATDLNNMLIRFRKSTT